MSVSINNQNSIYSFMYEMTGKTSISVLESSLKRMVTTYGVNVEYIDHKINSYKKYSHGFDNIWDAMITRGCINVLMSCGMTEMAAIASIRTILYIGVGSSSQGRKEGVKGERMGEGRKSHGTNKKFSVKSNDKIYVREWKQISLSNRSGALLDFVAEFYANYKPNAILYSRQKMITLMSRMNKRYKKTPSFSKIFGI